MADLHNRPSFLDAELSRMVSELARDVEHFDTLLHRQRELIQQQASDGEKAERRWRKIRAQAARITTKIQAVLSEMGSPIVHS